MDYPQYYSTAFSFDVSRMGIQEGSPFTRYLLLNDRHATFFGGEQWQDWEKDLEKIAPENKALFVLSLFLMVLTGYTLQKGFPQLYQLYRSITRFPMFGMEKEGYVYLEHPAWILARPLHEGLFQKGQLWKILVQSIPLFRRDFDAFSRQYLDALPYPTFISSYLGYSPEQPELRALSARLGIILRDARG